jgi:alpha-soluble NSF attachment protein
MAASNDQRAQEYLTKAAKLMKKSFFTSADPQGASDLYEKAANLYKLDKQWEKAGDALEKVAECQDALDMGFSAGRQYQAAALAYKNGASPKAPEAWKKAIGRYVEGGKFSQAGKAMKELAEQQEAAGEHTEAFSSISSAIDYLESAHEPVAASQMKSKAAELAVECGEHATASELFESVASNATISSTAVEPYFRASLCHLVAGDSVATSKCLQRFAGQNADFARSAEFVFVDEVIGAMDASDRTAFEEAIKKFDSKGRRLDPWKKRIVAKIATNFPKEGEEDLL